MSQLGADPVFEVDEALAPDEAAGSELAARSTTTHATPSAAEKAAGLGIRPLPIPGRTLLVNAPNVNRPFGLCVTLLGESAREAYSHVMSNLMDRIKKLLGMGKKP